jgi:secreted PhoX family phosphatase
MMTRRFLLGGTASAFTLGSAAFGSARAQNYAPPAGPDPEAPQLDDTVEQGFQRYVMIRWGDAVLSNAPAFNPDIPDEAAAARQFGWDGIIAGIVNQPAAEDGVRRCVMVVAHPDVWPRIAFPGGFDHPVVAGKMQGASVLNLSFRGGRWVTVDGGYQSRRITDGTLCRITGPAASVLGDTVQGLLAPQIGCVTPWNTVLLPEGHVGGWLRRLQGQAAGFADPAVAPRFGWVAEIDALNPTSFPSKRTALGRFARAGVSCGLARDGSAVVFMTENAPMGRLFRFKGAAPVAGASDTALDAGTLAVAQIEGDGIVWADLPDEVTTLTATLNAAGDAGGFDYPAGMTIARNGTLFLACSGNAAREAGAVNALNPRAGNPSGHVIAFAPDGGDLAARHFSGQVVLLGGNPAHDPSARYAPGSAGWLRSPRVLMLDRLGRLWVGTDQGGVSSGTSDGLFVMRTEGFGAFAIKPVYFVPAGGAIGGSVFGPDGRTLFTIARHPGAVANASFADPATRWPTLQPNMPPQTTMVALTSTF